MDKKPCDNILQVYEIQNDLGASVAQILDDNQMAYNGMDDYMDFSRIERYATAHKKASFDLTKVLQKNSDDKDLQTYWGPGIKMNWTPVPLEEQKCHINWRQSINDDGSHLARLASFPQDEDEAGDALTGAGKRNSVMQKNKEAMDSNSDSALAGWISEGKNATSGSDSVATTIKDSMAQVKSALGSTGGDALTVFSYDYATGKGGDYNAIVTKYNEVQGSIQCKNPVLIISAMAVGEEPVQELLKHKDGTEASSSGDKDKKDGKSSDESDLPTIKKFDPESVLWVDIAGPLSYFVKKAGHNQDDMAVFPKTCYLYCDLTKYIKNSKYDGDTYGFPFTDDECQAAGGIQYSGWYGEQRPTHVHMGVDLAPGPQGSPFHAIADGTVTAAGNGWGSGCNALNIQHNDGTYARYLHCSEHKVAKGDQVLKGDLIGITGGYGESGPNTYPNHLHIEFGHGDSEGATSDTDPISLWVNCPDHNGMFN